MMPDVSFSGLLIVAAVAFTAPLLLGLVPSLRLPAVVLEIVAGIVIGPSGLGLVTVDLPIQVLALLGLAFLLFLSGLEIEFERLRGRLLRVASLSFLLSFGLALLVSYGLAATRLIETPLLIAIILSATSLGVIIGVLKDARQNTSDFGQLVIIGASLADFVTVILLSLFSSREATSIATQLVLIGSLALLAVAIVVVVLRVEHSMRLALVLLRLQDTTAQIRVRGAFVLLIAFAALAERLGLEVILGAFIAGAILALIDRDQMMTHTQFRPKLEAIGFGIFIPIFFVASGLRFNLEALFANSAALAGVPVFLVALLIVRGVPALLYRPLVGGRRTIAAGLLQATSLSFIVAAAQIGMELGVLSEATGAALIAAGLLSVLLFPLGALLVLGQGKASEAARQAPRAA
jgi:Kef-type K+ transport system membrane component KefB